MNSTISFKCPSCGGTSFAVGTQPKSYKDFNGAPCTKCSRALSTRDVEKQASDIAAKMAKDIFKKHGFK